MPALEAIVAMHTVKDSTTAQAVDFLKNHFETKYSYTSYLTKGGNEPESGVDPITHFLLSSHSGHCEYFASATVMLLRQMGIPARYAVGYSVQELDEAKDRYIVRERHGHAWCLYWDEEQACWKDLDTTPGTWFAIEEQNASLIERFTDAISEFRYSFAKLRWLNQDGSFQRYLYAGLAMTMVFVFWRIMRNRNRSKRIAHDPLDALLRRQGDDSELYLIEEWMKGEGFRRSHAEPMSKWIQRIGQFSDAGLPALATILSLHYRYRFDSKVFPDEDRAKLADLSAKWLKSHRSLTSPPAKRT